MNGPDAIRVALNMSSMVMGKYLDDLSDEDLMCRPGPGCNHIAWQLGHLIASESQLLEMIKPGAGVELPAGFAEMHSKVTIADNNPENFENKQTYLRLFKQVHEATLTLLNQTSDADLDQPGPENFRSMFPTAGHIFMLIATHGLMHAGQLVPIRRALGKPVVI